MLEVMDTTLRDGEQTAGVSFNADEKLAIARLLLEELKVNRIEVGSARVSSGERDACAKVLQFVRSGRIAVSRAEQEPVFKFLKKREKEEKKQQSNL